MEIKKKLWKVLFTWYKWELNGLIFMANILELITIDENNPRRVPILTQESFSFCIRDISLPVCNISFVYFLILIKMRDYIYIGECKCIVTRLYNHNNIHWSFSTKPSHKWHFAILGHIYMFNDRNKTLNRMIERQWK